eukprot:15451838-Alexandrium_andersonii.AAC.1
MQHSVAREWRREWRSHWASRLCRQSRLRPAGRPRRQLAALLRHRCGAGELVHLSRAAPPASSRAAVGNYAGAALGAYRR